MKFRPFNQNVTYQNPWGQTSVAVAHANGSLSDQEIQKMSIEDLEAMTFRDIKHEDGIAAERYTRTQERIVVEKQGGYPGEVYLGVARVYLEWRRRKYANEHLDSLVQEAV